MQDPNSSNNKLDDDDDDDDYVMEDAGTDVVAEGREKVVEGATMAMASTTTNNATASNNNTSTSRSSSSSSSEGWQVVGNSASSGGDDDAKITSNNNDNDYSMSCDDESESKDDDDDDDDEESNNSDDGDEEFNFDMDEDGDDNEENKKDGLRSDGDLSLIGKAFDVDLLRDCIKRSEETLKHIEGKDVVLVVGKTGTGKSTFIQGIAGKTFQKSSFSCDDKNITAKDVFEADDPIPGFEIGHAKSSMTKHIRFFLRENENEIEDNTGSNNNTNENDNDNSKNKKEEKDQNRRIYYLDTPGFADTSGEEIDIATSSILNCVAKKCKTLRFVIIINYVSLLEDRGGSLRSILKFMRKFVSDFDKNKQSFMFLFSHADEIKDVPESLDGAKQSLLKEIIRTIDGTEKKDVDVIELLNFIQISLKKKFPFVDILHPLKTDFKSMTKFIEEKLKAVKVGSKNGTSCDLTGSSKMRLSGAVRKMLVDLRLLLKQDAVNIEEVRNIQTTFQFFDKYIHFEEMRGSVTDCNDIIGDHVKRLRGVVECELRNGTANSTTGCVSSFNKVNVDDLKDAILKLQAIDLAFNLQTEMNRITHEVTKYQKGLFIDVANNSFNGFSQDLQKLQAWCIFAPDYQELYDPVIAHTITTVKHVSDELSKFNTSQICSSSESALKSFFFYLKVLKSVHENAQGLSLYIPEVSGASNAFNDFVLRLKTDLQVWENSHSPLVMEVDFGNKQAVEYLTTQIRTLQMASGVIMETGIEDDIVVLVGSIQNKIESQVVGRFTEACLESKQSYHELDAAQWSERLAILRDIMSTFSDFEGSQWKEMEFSYKKLVDGTKSILKAKSGELDEMSNNALDHGVGDGVRDGKAVCSFAAYQWFDNFLPQEERFVKNCTTKIRNDYWRIFVASEKSVTVKLSWISNHIGNPEFLGESIEATKELKKVLLEIVECTTFSSTIGDREFSDHVAQLFDKVRSHIRSRVSYWQDTLNAWVDAVLSEDKDWEKLTVSTKILDVAISEMTEVIEMPCGESIKALCKSFKDETMTQFSNFNRQVQGFLDSKVSYEEFAIFLARVQALGDFPSTAPHLPRVEDLKEAARQRISSDAKNIEDMVEQTSEFDSIDDLLEDFEKAAVLDEFVSQEVSSRLRPLKRLRIEKEVDADGFITEMIGKNDFSGLGEFLSPLAKSKDQIKKLKLKKCMEKISKSLKVIDEKLYHALNAKVTKENGQKIASYVKILEQANDEAGDYIPKKNRTPSLGARLKTRRDRINTKYCSLLKNASDAIKRADFVTLAKLHEQAAIYSSYLGHYLSKGSEKKMKEALTDFSDLKRSVPSHIEKFIDSSFTKSWEVEKILTGLKHTTGFNDPIFNDLTQLYAQSTAALVVQVNDVLQKVKESAAEAHCYDDSIVIIQNLIRSFGKGLGRHLPQEFHNNCNVVLEELTEARQKQESDMDFEGSSVEEKLREWASLLDNLDPSSPWWKAASQSASRWITGQTTSWSYTKLKKRLNDKVVERNRRGIEALRRGEFVTVIESLDFLSRVDAIVGKHVPSASSKLKGFEKQATDSFLLICKHSQDALQSENCREFEPLFADFRGFVLNVACLTKDSNAIKSYHLINQLVYERMCKELSLLEKTLDSFEFSAMKTKIEEVRNFGGFIADRYALLHEELKGCNHIKSDKWLDDLKSLIWNNFQNGRDLQRIKFYAILEVLPSASKKDMKTAFKRKSLKCHPDKCKDQTKLKEYADEFRMVKNACDELEKDIPGRDRLSKPFDDQVRGLGERLREVTKDALKEQHYEPLKILLFKLQGIEIMEFLVNPKLDTEKINDDVVTLVKNHVEKVRTEVDSNWSQRKYQELNHNIKDLRMMEDNFKSYPDIFPSSWNDGIVEKVEFEIENLGKDCRVFLQDKTVANTSRDEFRRCFMRMGAVLVELPLFKDYTKKVMSDILESCLNSQWGYGFVFELGLSLQKGGETEDEDEIRIAQNLVTEFGHFKEVLTMVWNEETIQKPPEDTVRDIRGHCMGSQTTNATPVDIKPDKLLDQYFEFDSQYTSFLGEYLNPDADRNALVQKILRLCKNLKPVSCDHGFGDETKRALPTIMAGVFALFTVLKSGESYNRLEGDSNDCGIDAKNLLMKPHNIQVLTLLCMFGCGASSTSSLKSQLLQIRTGEGKSMILGAAAAILGLLGFDVRCVCYSEYLSSRDYKLFEDVFDCFGLIGSINYSKITTLSEVTTAKKGDIRGLSLSLMHDRLPSGRHATRSRSRVIDRRDRQEGDPMDTSISTYEAPDTVSSRTRTRRTSPDKRKGPKRKGAVSTNQRSKKESKEEILLVDEVDVFFGAEFYGQTYNQVVQLKEPEIASILKRIWESYKSGKKRLRLGDIKAMPEYKSLKAKVSGYDFLLENEIALMLDQVRRVDDEPFYHLDPNSDQIGYKVQDTICYNVTYGYRTVFAYMKEGDNGNLKDKNFTLSQVLTMPISCGQFSYANIKPTRILGVSGTLEVMSDYEKDVLQKYGVNQYLYIPSVYGKSNFSFDKAGEGVSIEKGASDYFRKITEEISNVSAKHKRAVIVFFKDSKRLKEYTSSAFYRKLGRKKEILTEDKSANEKEFVISKAATTGQVTICTAVFGRGTDFFCKDEALEKSGGVHVIQTFLSSDMSEEIQIQGRTARQGKKGSYNIILLDKDLEDDFGINCGLSDNWPRKEFYARLCDARKKSLEDKYASIEMNLSTAKEQDKATHRYFDALLDSNDRHAKELLKELYLNMKKTIVGEMDLDLAFAIDVTGSMNAYGPSIASTIQSLLTGSNSILAKLGVRFPDTVFKLRVGVLGFRDIDDGDGQFVSKCFDGNSHFSENPHDVLQFVNTLTASTSGGADLAEDHLGAIQHCVEWNSTGDWEGKIKAILLLTDAPAHGFAAKSTLTQNLDSYAVRHPLGLTVDSVVDKVLKKDIDLFVCSFDPISTEQFEENLSKTYNEHPSNVDEREVTLVPLVPKNATQVRSANGITSDANKHNIFVLDESGSMQHEWAGVVSVYNKFMQSRRQRQRDSDLVSVVQFDDGARVTCQLQNIVNTPTELGYNGGWTCFLPAALLACDLARKTPSSHTPVIIFMSDGMANDSSQAANIFAAINKELKNRSGDDLELHVIGFGGGTDTSQLQQIARASANGKVHTASDIGSLSKVFVQIATGGDDVAKVLEAEIGKRISEAVTNRLSAEYLG